MRYRTKQQLIDVALAVVIVSAILSALLFAVLVVISFFYIGWLASGHVNVPLWGRLLITIAVGVTIMSIVGSVGVES